MIITIDGPAGTGKTTVAQLLAEKIGYQYFDTGAMYRAVTYLMMQKGISLDHPELSEFLKKFQFEIRIEKTGKRYFVDGEDVTEVIRSQEVTKRVSEVAANPEVRSALVEIQRVFGKKKNSIFEGRDLGTVVFPQADVKFFLTARPAVRAERRYLELKKKATPLTEEEVYNQLLERDLLDSTREHSPLQQASDAHVIDTSDLSAEQVVERILSMIPPSKSK